MTAYLVIGVVGLVVLAISLLAGDLLEGVLDGLAGDWFSTEVVGSFVSALGFGGAIALAAGAPDPVAVVVGIAAGIVFGALGWGLTRVVRGGGTDSTPEADDVLGRDAVVVSDVPEGGFGTVRVALGGHTLRFNARSELPLTAGTEVHVTEVLSPTAVAVAPTWSALPPSEA